MIGRVGERRTFERLQRHGRRASTARLWCRYVVDPAVVPPTVGYAIGRAVGTAVARNRLRRRLRALLASHAGTSLLPSGELLVGARPGAAELTFDALGVEVSELLRRVAP